MKRTILMTLSATILLSVAEASIKPTVGSEFYGQALCKTNPEKYSCVTVPNGATTWAKLFPDERERDIVQKLNRTDTYLSRGKVLSVPIDLKSITIMDIAPFPFQLEKKGDKYILIDQNRLAWGAYNKDGKLVRWGPVSTGQDYCGDINRSCNTYTGIFYTFGKKGANCRSNIFPVGRGGSVMPYCMFFLKGYALHGSNEVFGYRASHGCVRMFTRDAQWLNQQFIDEPGDNGSLLGTQVIVQKPIYDVKEKQDAPATKMATQPVVKKMATQSVTTNAVVKPQPSDRRGYTRAVNRGYTRAVNRGYSRG